MFTDAKIFSFSNTVVINQASTVKFLSKQRSLFRTAISIHTLLEPYEKAQKFYKSFQEINLVETLPTSSISASRNPMALPSANEFAQENL